MSFELEEAPSSWRLEEQDVPETPLHEAIIELLMMVLKYWVAGDERSALVTSNLGCRWDPSDARVGTDPDVVLVEPAPPEGEAMTTLRVWESGHAAPRIAVEVVSSSQADNDYLEAPLRCARLGVSELWVFDPQLEGPELTGGPHKLQVWRLDKTDGHSSMKRSYAGPGPGYSDELRAWLVPTETPQRLRLADGPNGPFWPTAAEASQKEAEASQRKAEASRREAEALRARAEAEKARADQAELELAQLRTQLSED